jgi:hypothetical protein
MGLVGLTNRINVLKIEKEKEEDFNYYENINMIHVKI